MIICCRKSYQTHAFGDAILKELSRVLIFSLLLKKYIFTLEVWKTIINFKEDTNNHSVSNHQERTTNNLLVHSF